MHPKWPYLYFILVIVAPVLGLTVLFPERLLREPAKIERLYSVAGADVVVFAQRDCPHCRAFKKFALSRGWPVEYFDIAEKQGLEMFSKLKEKAPNLTFSTPTIVINGYIFQGYDNEGNSGARLTQTLNSCREIPDGCLSFSELLGLNDEQLRVIASGAFCSLEQPTEECGRDERYIFNLWLFGETDLQQLSLPLLSILLGFLDGFNPCAMWVLISLLTLLIALNDMRRMVIIGLIFLFVSGAMYYLFIAAWLNVFILLGYNFWVQKGIGLIAVGAGGFYLY
ncbi:MAG: glutaredoxin family protein, partial [Desulfobulbaceae bacterium]|nr:glutaredoxin family protein [Desulfobulbaceae bacterium]